LSTVGITKTTVTEIHCWIVILERTLPQVTEQADQAAVIQRPGGQRAWLQGRLEMGSGRIRLHFHRLCKINNFKS
jgi:hypothetical protein